MKLFTRVWYLLTLILFCTVLKAQQGAGETTPITISGSIKDKETNLALEGISISDGTKVLATSKQNGTYSVNVARGTTLQFSSVSHTLQTVVAENSQSGKLVLLSTAAKQLENVTVTTALGISRQQKALGYSVQTIDSNDLTDARSNNWAGALSGKVAGLSLLSPGSGPVNSTKITLRGNGSIQPESNNALIIVDGVPINTGGTTSGVGNAYGAGSGNDVPIDFGNGISDLNPEDIESITVLKGPGAAALYGSRGGNGALIITTKAGSRKNQGIGVTVNSNVSMNTVLKWPDYQYEYGQGTGKALDASGQFYYSYGASPDGAATSGTSSAFGPKFNGQQYYQYDPTLQGRGAERTLWRPYTDNIKGFWRTGSTITNNISLEGGNEKGSARASITHSKNEWIMPNTGFERVTAAVSLNYNLSEKLRLNTKVSYTNKQSDNLPATGYNNQSIAYFMIFQNPNVDLNWYRDRWKKGFEQVDQVHPFSSFIDNPFLIAHEMTNPISSNNTVGMVSANYEFSKKFDLMVRSGINVISEDRQQRRPFSTANFLRGYYKEQNIDEYELNIDGLLSYHDKISQDLVVSASVGANKRVNKYNRIDAYVDGLVIPGVYKLANGSGLPILTTIDRNKEVNSVYGLATLSYKNKYFIDVTGRNDWSSALPVANNSFFYPSVNTSFILSDIVSLPRQISYAKLRMSAAQVGKDTDPYRTKKYYGTSEFASSASVPTTLPNDKLKPEFATSYEAGIDLRLFKSRVRLDLSVYNNTISNQVVAVPLDPTTGYSSAFLNSGVVRNRGIEVLVTAQPVKTKTFTWSSTLTWARDKNKVLELAEGFSDKQDIGYGGNATIQARIGGTTGDIYGFGFLRSPDGQIVYTKDGLPARPTEIQFIGRAYADWRGGLQNEFSYKNFRFNFLIDGQYGGMIYSQTHHKMSEQGKLRHTLRGREENFIIGEGVVPDQNGKYIPNTKKVLPVDYYADYYRRANVEANSFDASFIKLREVRLEYSLPVKLLTRSFVRQVSIALYGRDLAMITNFPMFDPETAALNGSTLLPGVEMGQLPSTRTMGMNVTLKF
ncbi:MAG TPA: SusC/RagA family TonB-linked outer membrane protein [Chitinophagaceae bacterium]|nr:SusC/RagA family TonB-linked outer membrane protein [Chitinophagaceae bacterium]